MSIYYKKHNLYNVFNAVSGMGVKTIDVPFTPDYVRVGFHDVEKTQNESHIAGDDEVFFDLNFISPDKYQLVIGWNTYSDRNIYYKISKLTVDPV